MARTKTSWEHGISGDPTGKGTKDKRTALRAMSVGTG